MKWVCLKTMEKCPGTAGNNAPVGKVRGKGVPGPTDVKLPLSKLKKGAGGTTPGAGEKSSIVQLVTSTDWWLGFTGVPRLSRPYPVTWQSPHVPLPPKAHQPQKPPVPGVPEVAPQTAGSLQLDENASSH